MAGRKLKVAETAVRSMPDLRASVAASLAAMDWLTDADQALADVARSIADQIEAAHERADLAERVMQESAGDPGIFRRLQKLEAMCDLAKVVGWQGPLLQGVLRDLGGTPSARKSSVKPGSPTQDRLAALRAAAARPVSKSPSA